MNFAGIDIGSRAIALVVVDESARRLHRSVIRRAVAMLNRLIPRGALVFSGGVANNTCISHLLQVELQRPVLLPEEPQLVGAYGAVLLAMELG